MTRAEAGLNKSTLGQQISGDPGLGSLTVLKVVVRLVQVV